MPKAITSKKRGAFPALQRRVRARKAPEPEPESDETPSDSEAPSEEGLSDEGEDDEEDGSESDSESADEAPHKAKLDISTISFGALAKAQASMPAVKRRKGQKDESDDEDGSGSDSDRDRRRGKKVRPAKRSSKHAPTEMSSKKPVSRKREFDTIAKPQVRDPRFDAAINSAPGFDEARAKKAYAFLDEYRASEMSALRGEIKKSKNPEEKQRMERLLMSMESKKKSEDRKDRERRIIEDHRRAEKELVKQGKQPFYLKKSEQKKRLLTEQFKGMKKREVDKSIERRRKKMATRERIQLEQLERRT